jgi:hypothetical protein
VGSILTGGGGFQNRRMLFWHKYLTYVRFELKILELISKHANHYTYLLMCHCNQYFVKACWRRSLHDCLSRAQCVWPLGPGYRCSPHPPTWIAVFLDFSFHWVWLWIDLFVSGLRVLRSCMTVINFDVKLLLIK